MATELPDLEDLFAESVKIADAEKAAKDAKTRLSLRSSGNRPSAQTQADAELVKEWERQHTWESVAVVAHFERYECACGKHSTIFRQLMLKQVGKFNKGNVQWVQLPGEGDFSSLPKETMIQKWGTPMCPSCLGNFNMTLKGAKEWET